MKLQSLLAIAAAAILTAVPASAELRRVRVDTERSHFAARTGTAGLFGFLGHAHGIVATEWEARVCLDPGDLSHSEASVSIPVSALRIDTAQAFERAGIERKVDEEEQPELQQKMMSPAALDQTAHPEIVLRSIALALLREGRAELEGELTLHGRSHKIAVPVELAGLERGELAASGAFEIRLTDFGIEPESVGGVVRVADRVTVLFSVVGTLTEEVCTSPTGTPGK